MKCFTMTARPLASHMATPEEKLLIEAPFNVVTVEIRARQCGRTNRNKLTWMAIKKVRELFTASGLGKRIGGFSISEPREEAL